ncbi:MAG: HEPN domain-containing protein [Armatimonadota bacterium]|nr:HEPN domain-containing protein [Armatimonadota bacterium]
MSEGDPLREQVQEWYSRAELDLANARVLHATGPRAYDNVVFLCQQAIEKVIKTCLVVHGVRFPKIRDIARLLETYVVQVDPHLAAEAAFADELGAYAVDARYPDTGEPFDEETSERLLALTDRAWAIFEPRILEFLEADADAGAEEPRAPDA